MAYVCPPGHRLIQPGDLRRGLKVVYASQKENISTSLLVAEVLPESRLNLVHKRGAETTRVFVPETGDGAEEPPVFVPEAVDDTEELPQGQAEATVPQAQAEATEEAADGAE